jgi:multicomponent Na+:H+ antiporter subunit B
MKNNIVITITRFIFPFIVALGFYVQINGSDAPGGGFQSGVVMASSMILFVMVFGVDKLTQIISVYQFKVLAVLGMFLYGITGIICMIFGGRFLEYPVLKNYWFAKQTLGISMIEWGVGITVFAIFSLVYLAFVSINTKVSK